MSAPTITTEPAPLVKFTTGGAEVIASGTVITFTPADLTIQIEDLFFRFLFISEGTGNRIEGQAAGTKEITYRLYNFHNPLGTGLTEPVKVGKFRGKDLFFSISVYASSDKVIKTVHYTFFLKEAAHA
jgi:hypothetical protein